MINFFELDKKDNRNYVKLMQIVSKLSRLYTESDNPYIYYRAMENLFCYCFNAKNLSRSDTAFDAKLYNTGIGLKTFLGENKNITPTAVEISVRLFCKDVSKQEEMTQKICSYLPS